MPKVKLLRDVHEGAALKQSPARQARVREQRHANGSVTLAQERLGSAAVNWIAGTVVEMSEASARKYVERGLAEPYTEPK